MIKIKYSKIDGKKILTSIVLIGVVFTVIWTYIGALQAFVAPSQHFPLKMTQLTTLDSNNISTSLFSRNDIVRMNVTVNMAQAYYFNYPDSYFSISFLDDISYRIIIAILDPNNMPTFFYTNTKTVSPNDIIIHTLDHTISSSASLGDFKIRVMVWSDWLPGGLALSENAKEVIYNVS